MATNKKSTGQKAASQLGKSINRRKNLSRSLVEVVKAAPSYKDYLNLTPHQVSKLRTDELRAMVSRMNKVEKKRLSNLEKYGYNSAAVRGINDTGGATKAAVSMSRQELLHEYKRAKAFLLSETSTVKGAKQFVAGISEMAGADRELTSDEISRLYGILDKYKESGAIGFYKKGDKKSAGYINSQATQQDIYDMMSQGQSDDEILSNLGIMSRTDYEAMQDTSDNFNWIGAHHP